MSSSLHPATTAGDTDAILRLAAARSQALARKDVAALDRILAQEFVYMNASGQVMDKASYLALYVESPGVQWFSQELDQVQLRLFGDAAVLTCRLHDRARFGEQELDARYQSTTFYLKTSTGRQCVAGHTGPAAE